MIAALYKVQALNDSRFKLLQRQYNEQRIASALFYLLELIYYKTVPPEFREKPFKPDHLRAQQIFFIDTDDQISYIIAKDHLDTLVLKVLRVLHLLIQNNRLCCEAATRHVDILFRLYRW